MTGVRVWDLMRYFADGRAPMALGGTYEWPRIQDQCAWADTPEEAISHMGFALAPRPLVDQAPVSSLGGTSWVIMRQSAHQELSLEILKLASRQELSLPFCRETLQISPLRSANATFASEGHSWLSTVAPWLRYARTRPSVRNYMQVSMYLQRMFELVLWAGAPIEEIVQRTAHSLELLI
jgi:ABC-type glycerol-3-phosphate transport system substrate-binding protein